MKRQIYLNLIEWKNNKEHKPLILLGARQVGKTYILKEFGKNEFDDMIYINCHNNSFAEGLFHNFDIDRILYQIEQAYEKRIVPGKTLLFFDEIQEVKNGIPALKYFCENKRELHVVVAGSLLGISLREDESYPVGKVNDLRMYPMTFGEFLLANNRQLLAEAVEKLDWDSLQLHHDTLVEYLRQYYFVGGMPEVVLDWVENKDAKKVRSIQRSILSTYNKDMGKHTKTDVIRIRQVWNSIPAQLAKENKKFIFGIIKKGARSAEFDKALQWLADAGLIYRIPRISKPEEPLKFYADESAFKVFMLDHGLLACMCGARSSQMLLGNGAFTEFKGSFTENYVVGQIKSLEIHDEMDKNIFYYSKDNSSMEVDMVVQTNSRVIPTEVKAEVNVQSKSLYTFVNDEFREFDLKGLRISMLPYKDQNWMENVPLYAAGAFFQNTGLGTDD